MQHEELTGKQKFLKNLNLFLSRNGKLLLGILFAAVIVIIFVAIFNSYKTGKNEQSAIVIEKIQNEYNELQNIKDDETAYNEGIDKILSSLDSAISDYSAYYAAQRALFMKGDILFSKNEYDKAIESYSLYAEKFPGTYLAPISLYNAGICYEEKGEAEKAAEIYKSLVDKYEKTYPDIPHVIFSVARVYESLENYEKAGEYYNKVLDNYQNSGWTNFARDRIIYLKASGLIKK